MKKCTYTTIDHTSEKMKELIAFMAGVKDMPYAESNLIAILHKAQALYGYLDGAVMDEIAMQMKIPTAHIWGVATFYHYFNLKPQGKHTISICMGTACYVKGAQEIFEAIKTKLNIGIGDTTPDNLFTFQEARCLGACGLAPVVMIDDKIYGELDAQKIAVIIDRYIKKS